MFFVVSYSGDLIPNVLQRGRKDLIYAIILIETEITSEFVIQFGDLSCIWKMNFNFKRSELPLKNEISSNQIGSSLF